VHDVLSEWGDNLNNKQSVVLRNQNLANAQGTLDKAERNNGNASLNEFHGPKLWKQCFRPDTMRLTAEMVR
jgi:hypothetical protein